MKLLCVRACVGVHVCVFAANRLDLLFHKIDACVLLLLQQQTGWTVSHGREARHLGVPSVRKLLCVRACVRVHVRVFAASRLHLLFLKLVSVYVCL